MLLEKVFSSLPAGQICRFPPNLPPPLTFLLRKIKDRFAMGNAPSIAELPPEWDDILPNITQEDIILSSRNKCKVVVRPPSQDDDNNNGNDKSSTCVYLNDDIFDLDDDDHVPTALAILRSYPHLKDVSYVILFMVTYFYTHDVHFQSL